MSVSAGRVVCPRCGANNFDTQAACWKCGASLSASLGATPAPTPPAAATPNTAAPGAGRSPSAAPGAGRCPAAAPQQQPPPIRQPVAAPAAAGDRAAAVAVPRPAATVDPAVAGWSAAILGLLFPWFAVPAGMVFLMLDDRRKLDVGRIAIIWGVVGFIIHTLITGWLFYAALAQLNPMNLIRMRQSVEQAQMQQPQQAQPRLNDEVPPLDLPGFPRVGR